MQLNSEGTLLIKSVKINDLFDCKTTYLENMFKSHVHPWEMLPKINSLIEELINNGIDGYKEITSGILVGKDVKIASSAVIEPPAIIGTGSEIRHCAYIRGNVITGERCVIGNSSELKNSILLNNVQVPHYNYVGDSILGNFSHMGAGAICSNLKSDKKTVTIHAEADFKTNLRKIGAILGDGVEVGCGCVLNPGTVIGKNTTVYPLTSVRGVIPENCIVKDVDEIVEKINNY